MFYLIYPEDIGSISRSIGNFFGPQGGLITIARLCSRSYGNGILVTYNLTGGNEAVELSTTLISTESLNSFELFLHLTVSFAWAFGIVGSITAHTYRSVYNTLVTMTIWALPKGHKESNTITDNRSMATKYSIGLPGILIGITLGSCISVMISFGRIISNSWKSMVFVTTKMTNLVLPDDAQNATAEEPSATLRYLVGAPGLLLGAVIGTVSVAAVSAGRIISNSWRSMLFVTTKMTNLVLPDDAQNATAEEPSATLRYLVGAPGLLLGAVIGTVSVAAVSAGRIISNSWKSMISVTKTMTNFALHESDQFSNENTTVSEEKKNGGNKKISLIPDDSAPNKRSWVLKYLIGTPGIIAGFLIGAIGFTSVVFSRILINSPNTFFDVSGAFLNVAIEREVFNGLQNKSTVQKRWGFGFPGALLSLSVAALGAGILTVRRAIPISLGIITSPLTALWRLSRESWKYYNGLFRFAEKTVEKPFDPAKAKLKNLFSSLTAMGDLPEGKPVTSAGNGPIYTDGFFKPFFKFLRKALTFNQQTLTEQVLSKVVENLNQKNAEENITHVVTKSIDEIKNTYQHDSHWVTPDSEKRAMNTEIDRVGGYIKEYCNAEPLAGKTIPDLYLHGKTKILFFSDYLKDKTDNNPDSKDLSSAKFK